MTQETLFSKKMGQKEKILKVLAANNDWINGQYFVRVMGITQYHARILELERMGYEIEHSDFTDDYGFRSYRLKNRAERVEEKSAAIAFAPAMA